MQFLHRKLLHGFPKTSEAFKRTLSIPLSHEFHWLQLICQERGWRHQTSQHTHHCRGGTSPAGQCSHAWRRHRHRGHLCGVYYVFSSTNTSLQVTSSGDQSRRSLWRFSSPLPPPLLPPLPPPPLLNSPLPLLLLCPSSSSPLFLSLPFPLAYLGHPEIFPEYMRLCSYEGD